MNVVFTDEADEHADAADQWWRQNRPAAPALFHQELLAAVRLIAESPSVGTLFRKGHRRVRLQKTRHHVYYVIDADSDVLTVVAVWGMPKRKAPKL